MPMVRAQLSWAKSLADRALASAFHQLGVAKVPYGLAMDIFNRRSKAAASPAVRETQYLISSGDDDAFAVHIEPEGMEYEFPPHEKVLLTFRQIVDGPQYIDVSHHKDALVIWRPADTEVWATTADGRSEQIAGWEDNPFPWMDSGHKTDGPAPWTWPPSSGSNGES
jgi:hypothetical protein